MARVKRGVTKRKSHKKVLKLAKGFKGAKKNHYRQANENLEKSMMYATRDRKVKKREFRSHWITNLSIACEKTGFKYSRFIDALKKKNVTLSRPMLYKIAVNDFETFGKIADFVR
ncbi:MAG: 50S ribosomal protein L20 [Elusimicrobia bacterium CG03_land_8_20_14_0_80_50_18]|nr:MAG: 50S ribosomal protein L20 [Elusimicrobia bacterium CG03_land_8_20_14_0_80_50_18]